MIRVLSTKKLSSGQKQVLLDKGFSVAEADFIRVKNNSPELKDIKQNLLFTSRNAVKSILENESFKALGGKNCFCVGEKTKQLLEEKGFAVIAFSEYAADLAQIISEKYKTESFTFFCGNLRQDDLPGILKRNTIIFNEIRAYETFLSPHKINPAPQGILFFSPSAVESFLQNNPVGSAACFCIGKTTAKALEGQTDNIIIADQPSVENVIAQTINFFSQKL